MVQHLMGRSKAGLDADKMLVKGSGSIGDNLHAFCPLLLTMSLNSLVHGDGVAWEEVCLDEGQGNQWSEASNRPE